MKKYAIFELITVLLTLCLSIIFGLIYFNGTKDFKLLSCELAIMVIVLLTSLLISNRWRRKYFEKEKNSPIDYLFGIYFITYMTLFTTIYSIGSGFDLFVFIGFVLGLCSGILYIVSIVSYQKESDAVNA